MSSILRFWAIPLVALTGVAQDSADKAKETRAKLNDLRKQLKSKELADQMAALDELGGIYEDEARTMIIGKIASPNEAVRSSAINALAKQRHPAAAAFFAQMLETNRKKPEVIRSILGPVQDLDMCALLPTLAGLLEVDNYNLAKDLLKVMTKIGDPDVAPRLLPLLKKCEANEQLGGRKDGKLAGILQPLRTFLSTTTNKSFNRYSEWEKYFKGEGAVPRVASLYFCPVNQQTFEISFGKPHKCPTPDAKSHTDVFLKHKQEAEMVGGRAQ